MDSEGYLPIHLIASFQRVQNLTQDFEMVVRAIMSSPKLEVKEACVRTIMNPLSWPLGDAVPISPVALYPIPMFSQFPSPSSAPSSPDEPELTQSSSVEVILETPEPSSIPAL